MNNRKIAESNLTVIHEVDVNSAFYDMPGYVIIRKLYVYRGVTMPNQTEVVIITGMSGAGKTVAMQSFEDLGYYTIDNMPPSLIPTFLGLSNSSSDIAKVALVMDLRMRDFFEEMVPALEQIEESPHTRKRILFLDASDEELVTRYKETRRSHPLAQDGRVLDGITKERELLEPIKNKAHFLVDTSDLKPRELREKILETFKATNDLETFRVEMISFGFKYGLPLDADIVMDVRFLPNPHYIDELRPQTGLDKPVYDYVMQSDETEPFYRKFIDLLEYSVPGYKKEGKTNVTIAIGCTGGQHRSVALTERVGAAIKADGYSVNISHRDIRKKKESVVRS